MLHTLKTRYFFVDPTFSGLVILMTGKLVKNYFQFNHESVNTTLARVKFYPPVLFSNNH